MLSRANFEVRSEDGQQTVLSKHKVDNAYEHTTLHAREEAAKVERVCVHHMSLCTRLSYLSTPPDEVVRVISQGPDPSPDRTRTASRAKRAQAQNEDT